MSDNAKDIFAREPSIKMTPEETLRFIELWENPPPRNQRFLEAQARYEAMIRGEQPDLGSPKESLESLTGLLNQKPG